MPFKSKAQAKLLFATKPELEEEFSSKMSKKSFKKLPEKVKKKR
jgi:hypothetical protein